jgi:hypothetical protein
LYVAARRALEAQYGSHASLNVGRVDRITYVAPVTAYLDGGTISLIVAAIAGAVAGVGTYAQAILRTVKKWIRRDRDHPDQPV